MMQQQDIETETTVDYIELTARLGLPDHDATAVLSWTGEGDPAHLWTEREVDKLIEIWHADTARIARERG